MLVFLSLLSLLLSLLPFFQLLHLDFFHLKEDPNSFLGVCEACEWICAVKNI